MADAKVCIVDDDRSILDSLRGLLASEKIAAMTFDDSRQFLDYVQVHHIRAAILDVAMPGLSGIQLQSSYIGCAEHEGDNHDCPTGL